MTKLGAWFVLVGAIGGLAACKRPGAEAPRRPEDPFAGIDCSAVRAPVEPDLTAWEASSRAELDKLRRQGVVAVRYEAHGCDVSLELLPGCVGPKNRYVYSPYKSTETKIAASSSELLAQIPLGATNVTELLGKGRALRTDERVVGAAGLPAGATITEYDLVGPECKRATHVVQAVYVGGYARAAGDARSVGATDLFTAPPADGMAREGSAPICDRSEAEGIELAGCAAPIRLALVPLGRGTAPEARPSPRDVSCKDGDGGCAASETAAKEPRAFDPHTVERMVREKQAAVKRKCWEVAPDTLRRVSISVSASIDTQGRVIDPQAQLADFDGSADVAAAVSRCIAGEIQTWQFPEPEKPTAFTVPFHLIRQ